MLAALRPMVSGHLQFRTLTVGGIPIIVQNFDGRVRAFANVCRHRLSRIHREEFGTRPLVCPYHNWSYDFEGVLRSVPRNDTLFQMTPDQIANTRLRQYAIEIVGGLVFVNLSETPLPIAMQFGDQILNQLAAATDHMDDEFIYTRYEAEFNWKTGIENIKDPLHVQCLHRESFPSYIQVRHAGTPHPSSIDPDDSPCWRDVALTESSVYFDAPLENAPRHPWQELVENLDSVGSYRAMHLFPNVNLMIVDGTSFSVQVYNPIGPERTEMQMMVLLTREVRPLSYKPVVLWEHLKSDMTVLNEDLTCLEALQKNFSTSLSEVRHGSYETGIMDFHSAYLGVMTPRPDR